MEVQLSEETIYTFKVFCMQEMRIATESPEAYLKIILKV